MDTHCHKEGGCIRAFEDDTCGEHGQCSIVLAVLAERERCVKAVKESMMLHYMSIGTGNSAIAKIMGAEE